MIRYNNLAVAVLRSLMLFFNLPLSDIRKSVVVVVLSCLSFSGVARLFKLGGGALRSMEDSRGAREKTSDKKNGTNLLHSECNIV